MSKSYSAETRKILNDFLQALTRNQRVDPAFLTELRQMTTAGELGDTTRIRQALAVLKESASELHDR